MVSLSPEGAASRLHADEAVDLRDRFRAGGRWSVEGTEVSIAIYGTKSHGVVSWFTGTLDETGALVRGYIGEW